MSDEYLALQVIMMPKDANPVPTPLPGHPHNSTYCTIFGGVLLSYIDQAGAIAAYREVIRAGGDPPMLVTVAFNRVEFLKPVLVGDVVRFMTKAVRFGRTSITMHVRVEAERGTDVIQVTEAEVVYVGVEPVDGDRRPKALLPDGTSPP